jgi:hypothetical protein
VSDRFNKLEEVSALVHRQWCNWARYMLDNLTEENKARWYKQIDTSYLELPETQKDSDRAWAALYLFLLNSDNQNANESIAKVKNMEQGIYKQINNILTTLEKNQSGDKAYRQVLTDIKREVNKLQSESKASMDNFGAGIADI